MAVQRLHDLHRRRTDRACRGGDEHARTERDPHELGERDPRREERHREGGALGEARGLGKRKEPAPVDDDALRVAAALRADEAHHARAVELARDLGAEHGRELGHLRVHPEPDQDVREVDSRGAHVDDRLPVGGLGLGHLLDDELLRPADALQDSGSHRPVNWGSRFSMNAATPSAPSSDSRQRRKPSASRRSPSSSGRSRVVRASSRRIADGDGRARGDRPGDPERRLAQLLARHDLLDEPPVVRGRGVDEVAGHVEVLRAPDPDEPRQPLRAAAAGDEAELDLRLPELGVVGDHADVAAHRELETSAEAEAVDRRDERRARRVHAVPELLDPARRAALVRLGRRLAQRRETP